MTTATIFAKKDYVSRDGQVPLYLRITINRKTFPIALEKRIRPEHWDDAGRQATRQHPNAQKFNILLLRIQTRADEILLDHELSGRPVTFESFKKEFGGNSPYDYYDLVETYKRQMKGSCSDEYLEKVTHVTNKLREFAPVLEIGYIDYNFLKRYQHHLATVRNNGKNTIHSNMRIFRRILKEGVNLKLIKENPFENFRLEKAKVHKDVLTIDELQKYEDLLKEGSLLEHMRNALCYFLLAVYTGRRYQDLQHFYEWTFNENHIRVTAMKRIRNQDVRKVVIIYLNDRIRAISDEIRKCRYIAMRNAQANEFLGQLNNLVGVEKKIRFHSARHTFNYINKKLASDLSVRKELLGHDNINSTMIYEHVDEDLLKAAMLKWNAIG
jgi:site-specific recombinase XerC